MNQFESSQKKKTKTKNFNYIYDKLISYETITVFNLRMVYLCVSIILVRWYTIKQSVCTPGDYQRTDKHTKYQLAKIINFFSQSVSSLHML